MNQMNQMAQDQFGYFEEQQGIAQAQVEETRADYEAFQFTNPFADAQNAFGGIQTQFGNIYAGTQSLEGFKNLLIYFFAFLGSALSFDNMYVAVGLGVILSSYLCFLTWEKYFTKNPTVYAFMVYIFLLPHWWQSLDQIWELKTYFPPGIKLILSF